MIPEVSHYIFIIVELTLIIFIVIVSSVVCAVKLRADDRIPDNTTRRHATITILIISACFCAVNIAYLVCTVIIVWYGNGNVNYFTMFAMYPM